MADDGSIYVTGYTSSTDFPVVDPWQGVDAGGSNDCMLFKINPSDSLEYSTFLGGTGNDSSRGLAMHYDGTIAITGGVFSQDFPMLNPLQGTYGGGETEIFIAAFDDVLQSVEGEELQPTNSIILGVSPNPASSQAAITLTIPEATPLELGIFDLSGRIIETITADEIAEPGSHTLNWEIGHIPTGIYILRATAPGLTTATEMVVIL